MLDTKTPRPIKQDLMDTGWVPRWNPTANKRCNHVTSIAKTSPPVSLEKRTETSCGDSEAHGRGRWCQELFSCRYPTGSSHLRLDLQHVESLSRAYHFFCMSIRGYLASCHGVRWNTCYRVISSVPSTLHDFPLNLSAKNRIFIGPYVYNLFHFLTENEMEILHLRLQRNAALRNELCYSWTKFHRAKFHWYDVSRKIFILM